MTRGQQKASWIKNLVDAPSPSEWRALKAEHEAELHRLQTRIAELEAQLEATGAGGVEPLRKPAAAQQAVPGVPEIVKLDRGFRWDSEKQHHVPTLLIEFTTVPANSPNTEKGWKDRDALAAALAATQPAAQGMDATVLMGYMHPGNFERHQHSRWKTGAPCALRLNGWTGEPLQVAVYAKQADVDAALAAQAKQGEQP